MALPLSRLLLCGSVKDIPRSIDLMAMSLFVMIGL